LRSVGSIPAFNLKPLLKFRIPLPPLEQQEKIIDAMDSYESLINGLLIDIPSEIVARDKEYEYYRNKLLTFNVMEVA
jgi:type I restriction enzyme S subunit